MPISEKQYNSIHSLSNWGKNVSHLIVSQAPCFVTHGEFPFNKWLWKNINAVTEDTDATLDLSSDFRSTPLTLTWLH